MKTLDLHPLEEVDHLIYPEDMADITENSPALLVLTDFKLHRPFVIESTTPIDEAENLMKRAHVKLKLVVNKEGKLRGIIAHADLESQHILQLTTQGYQRRDITVGDLMIPRRDLSALDYDELRNSTIGQIIATLKQNGVQHCLVVDKNTHSIRGLISASDIARKLHLPVEIHRTPTFVEIFEAVRA